MDQGVAGCAALDFAQPHQVAAFEAPVAVLEFPQGHVRSAGVEDVIDCARADERAVLANYLQECGRGGDGGNRPLWKPYMLSWRTNDEMFVCLKYWLWQRLEQPRQHHPLLS